MLQSFRLALKSLAGSKLRSFLTMLGIIIGVASVIVLVSLMDGMTSYIIFSIPPRSCRPCRPSFLFPARWRR